MSICKEYMVDEERELFFTLETCKPCHFRFLECDALLHRDTLRISEHVVLPGSYVAISYVWKGLASAPGVDPGTSLRVAGTKNADPINITLLKTAALAAVCRDCDFLWLDQLCIIQTSREDKDWQITHMYDIYRGCQICLAFVGGLGRLSDLFEPWPWVTRAWTLQEALVPPEICIVFAWSHGEKCYQANAPIPIREIEKGKSAMLPLGSAIYALSVYDSFSNMSRGIRGSGIRSTSMRTLHIASNHKSDARSDPIRAFSILQCSILRTSSRPVDMILSIMGLLDVDLDPSQFAAADREKALLMLLRHCLDRGQPAWWLALSIGRAGGSQMTYLPPLPLTTVCGTPQVSLFGGQLASAESQVGSGAFALKETPHGHMRVDGLLTLYARTCRVKYVASSSSKADVQSHLAKGYLADKEEANGSTRVWEILETQRPDIFDDTSSTESQIQIASLLGLDPKHTFWDYFGNWAQEFCAVHVGALRSINTGEFGAWYDPEPNVFFLLEKAHPADIGYWTKIGDGKVTIEDLESWKHDTVSVR